MNILKTMSRRNSLSGAFTIIELVVSIGVTSLLVVLMLTVTLNMLSGWNRSSGVLNTGNQARYILDQLTLDLQGSVRLYGSNASFVATIQRNQNVNTDNGDADVNLADWPTTGTSRSKPIVSGAHPADSLVVNHADVEKRNVADYRFGHAGVWLRFFTNVSDNDVNNLENLSAPRAVSYQIVRRQRIDDANAPFSYQLFRSEVRPYGDNPADRSRSTFNIGYDLLANNNYNETPPETFPEEDPARIRKPGLESLIGDGVIDFGVRVFSRVTDTRDLDGDGAVDDIALYEVFPVDRRLNDGDGSIRESFVCSTNLAKVAAYATASGNPTAAQTSYASPDVVEVMIRILTPQGIQTLQAYEQDPSRLGGFTALKWWELAIQNSNVYTQRIELNR